ncbi:uncharacterized protein A4U43_C06F18720 [Asparagus officinalis]|uniref:Uncharacterized protein n=1 Tax=Asparagus officinalis TaxID=4686 RepID=A0A5P1ETB7_ASPOF|nr:uncharacterized protein A4U43_C06F18720 [Asparagus officinalis]
MAEVIEIEGRPRSQPSSLSRSSRSQCPRSPQEQAQRLLRSRPSARRPAGRRATFVSSMEAARRVEDPTPPPLRGSRKRPLAAAAAEKSKETTALLHIAGGGGGRRAAAGKFGEVSFKCGGLGRFGRGICTAAAAAGGGWCGPGEDGRCGEAVPCGSGCSFGSSLEHGRRIPGGDSTGVL